MSHGNGTSLIERDRKAGISLRYYTAGKWRGLFVVRDDTTAEHIFQGKNWTEAQRHYEDVKRDIRKDVDAT